ncbi:MAG: alpha/beta hydrolase family protein [Pseudomonadales bacterium]
MSSRIRRESYGVVYHEKAAFKDTYGGEPGAVFIECMRIRPEDVPSRTVFVFSHPVGGGAFLPIMNQLARAGIHVLYVNTHYRGNDSALIMEKCLLDLGAGIRDARERFGYDNVILGGWSGGGSLALFYQEQAQAPTIEATPAGDPVDIKGAGLVQAQGIVLMAAHVSRSVTLTEWMDPSIIDERDPDRRNPALDLYDARNPAQPPYATDFLAHYRAAQVARNRRITEWVKERLDARIAADGPGAEEGFVVHGTMADPRWLDPLVDPNDRVPGTCYLGDPRIVNMGPVGLARFCTLRSWLSQWSFDESRAHGQKNAANVRCPVLVIGNGADNACTPSHTARLFDAVGYPDKQRIDIAGATHYYAGQPEQSALAANHCADWFARHGWQ